LLAFSFTADINKLSKSVYRMLQLHRLPRLQKQLKLAIAKQFKRAMVWEMAAHQPVKFFHRLRQRVVTAATNYPELPDGSTCKDSLQVAR